MNRQQRRSEALTVWIIVLIVYNGFLALQWTGISALMVNHWPTIRESMQEDAEAAEYVPDVEWAMQWSLVYAATRITCTLILVWFYRGSESGFWCYSIAAVAAFSINLWGGSSLLESVFDLIGLAILVALFFNVPNSLEYKRKPQE